MILSESLQPRIKSEAGIFGIVLQSYCVT